VIRCVLDDVGLDLVGLDDVATRAAAGGLDVAPWAVHEVLVVSADTDVLAAAGALGLNRLRAADPAVTADAVRELCRELDRP